MEKIVLQKGGINTFRWVSVQKSKSQYRFGISWRCVLRNCGGRIKELDDLLNIVTEHNHSWNVEQGELRKIMSHMKQTAKETVEKPRQIILNSTAGMEHLDVWLNGADVITQTFSLKIDIKKNWKARANFKNSFILPLTKKKEKMLRLSCAGWRPLSSQLQKKLA